MFILIPDTVTILPHFAELNLSKEGKTIHGFTLKRAPGLVMYMKCNRVKEAEQFFEAMPEHIWSHGNGSPGFFF